MATMTTSREDSQKELDALNAAFWNEPCGTKLAQRTNTTNNFEAFDREYFRLYPFLKGYLDRFSGYVLEIGVGYGTVGQYLKGRCNSYIGVDIATEPLKLLTSRGLVAHAGNVLELPKEWTDTFDGVVSIGCIHHTGDMHKALDEIYRVTKKGGRALVMLYNAEADNPSYDRNSKGEPAPCVEHVTINDVQDYFECWDVLTIKTENAPHNDIYIEAIK